MWQVLVAAAAAAGSSILAKKFISPNGAEIETPISECKQKYLDSDDSVPKSDDAFEDGITGKRMEIPSDDAGVFRFSCPGTASKELRKNARSGFGFLKKNGGSKKKGAANVAANHQVGDGSGKRVSICLKKRRTGKHAAGKCESCVSKGYLCFVFFFFSFFLSFIVIDMEFFGTFFPWRLQIIACPCGWNFSFVY